MILPNAVPLLGCTMLYVAAVLYIIALNAEGKVGAKETAAMSLLTGTLANLSGLYAGYIMGDPGTMAASLLFGFTYYLLAFNLLVQTDTYTGLGNYCLFVVLACVPFFWVNAQAGAWILAFFWVLWGQLWAVFWIANGLKRNLGKLVPYDTYLVAVINFIVAVMFIFGWANFSSITL